MPTPNISDEQFAQIHSLLESQGGFTVNPYTGAPRTKGISVAPLGNEHREPVESSTPDVVKTYHGANLHRYERGASLGGWRFGGTDFLDTPTIYEDTPGGRSNSRYHMLVSKQLASYNLETKTEDFNPFHPENPVDPRPNAPTVPARAVGPTRAPDTPLARSTWLSNPKAEEASRRKRSRRVAGDLDPVWGAARPEDLKLNENLKDAIRLNRTGGRQ